VLWWKREVLLGKCNEHSCLIQNQLVLPGKEEVQMEKKTKQ
jgi:hypothetical protein